MKIGRKLKQRVSTARRRISAGATAADAGSSLERAFARLWLMLKDDRTMPPAMLEHAFAASIKRRWRFDFAWPEQRVAVELEGTTKDRTGRHQQQRGYTEDCHKYNAAVILGWAVLRYTSLDIARRPVQVIEEVQRLLEIRKRGVIRDEANEPQRRRGTETKAGR